MGVSTWPEASWMGSNYFTVPQGGTTITFNYNFLTEEGYNNDNFSIGILDANGLFTGTMFTVIDVDNATLYPIIGETTGPHGSHFTKETGVLSGTVNIPATFGGQTIALAFAIIDVDGDRYGDSAVLIDNVSSPVPNGDFEGGLLGAHGFIGQSNNGWYMYGGNVHLLPDGSLPGVDTTGLQDNYAYLSNGPGAMAPEPVSAVLFVTGAAILGGRRLWRRR